MLWHPDKFSNDKDKWNEAHHKFIKIVEAYELLENYEVPKLKEEQKEDRSTFRPTHKNKSERANIVRLRVKSSNIFSVGYDSITKTLQVEFKNGIIYEYYEVPEIIYSAFMNAESKGKFGNKNIFYKYHYKQVI